MIVKSVLKMKLDQSHKWGPSYDKFPSQASSPLPVLLNHSSMINNSNSLFFTLPHALKIWICFKSSHACFPVSFKCRIENFLCGQLYHRSVAPALCTFSLFLFSQGGPCFSTQTPKQIQRQDGGSRGKVSLERVYRLTLTLGLHFSKCVCVQLQLPRSPLQRVFTF